MNYHLSRRRFLKAITATALTQMLLGCDNAETISQILFLESSVPSQLIGNFHKIVNGQKKVNFKPQSQLGQIFDLLLNLQQNKKSDQKTKSLFDKILNKSVVNPDLTTLGDIWLSSAIKQNLIQPLSVKDLVSWQKLPTRWQQLVRRNNQGKLATDGQIYGAPYRWGSTVIAYQSDKLDELGITVSDWQDLWQPELRDRISLLDSPREVIGLTLKKLGRSYNTENLDFVPDLETELLALHKQAKLYSSEHYLEPLILGDTWVAVGWSTDILPLLKRYPEIKLIVPKSGTSLWADLWVKPQIPQASLMSDSQQASTVVEKWIDYCWQPQAAKQISLFTNGISPVLSSLKPEEIPEDLKDNLYFNSAVLNSDKSEFLLPLEPATEQQYQDLWVKIRQS
ncbi:MAG TPA: extracellular solute-binding protein [Coleofasciculaceae cyanobacterium]|jgi:putative spermidine/putrescine transport system substrate-binding protein